MNYFESTNNRKLLSYKNSFKQIALALVISLLYLGSSYAQQTITGNVTDDSGLPLPGVSVVAENTSTGTTTDFDGNYTITVDDGITILQFSYIGYVTENIQITGNTINIQMKTDVTSLDEIVVTGYTSQSKRNVTGSIAIVSTEELQNVNAASVAQQLQGQAAGVQVLNENRPGGGVSVRVRGFGTINNNNPLFIVDGIKVRGNLNNINPNDIESFQILKDASSAAIYGVEGANGVVVITTKKGKRNRTELNFDAYNGIQFVGKVIELANTQQWGQILWQQRSNAGDVNADNGFPSQPQYGNGPAPVIPDFILPTGAFEGAPGTALEDYSITNRITRANKTGTDWYDEILRPAQIESYQVSASGGGDHGTYALSANYFNQEGIVDHTSFNRYTIRANTQFDISDRIRIGQTLQLSLQQRLGNFNDQAESNAISGAYRMQPIVPVRDIAGNFAGTLGGSLGNFDNPVAILERGKNNGPEDISVIGSLFGEYDLLKNISFRTNFGLNIGSSSQSNFSPRRPENIEQSNTPNRLEERSSTFKEWIWTNSLKYENSFGDHYIKATAFLESNRQETSFQVAAGTDFKFENRDFLILSNAANQETINSGRQFFNRFSLFGQAEYRLKERYLLSGTFRRDGSSLFADGAREANFASMSAGWIISEENFMADLTFINYLKLFAGYGELGNDKVPFENQFDLYDGTIRDSGFDINGTNTSAVIGFRPSRIGNIETTWETTATTNIGLTFGILNNRLTSTVEWYQRDTKNMLVSRELPSLLTGVSAPFINIGEMRNTGFDLQLSYKGSSRSGDFTYNISANISRYKNEVVALSGGANDFFEGATLRSVVYTRTAVGSPISSFYGYVVDGIFQNQAEVDAHASFPEYNAVGKFKFRDISGPEGVPDGIINADDQKFIGSPHPDFSYGLTLNLGYKNLDFSAFLIGVQGNEVINQVRRYTEFSLFEGGRSPRLLTDTWTPNNPGATLPILDSSDTISGSRPSTVYVEDGSYLRLKNIELGYTLPQHISETIGINRLRLYVQAQNFFTITNYSGFDPELTSGNGTDSQLGVDEGSYPVAKSVLLGLNVSL